ncbi:putative quinol monooxygenase [Acinetobacter sp.]|uniref:putative quinol monooxygenase n=1 Tax=Acinetobacter sp. TaxID=472 RepID=UPI0031E3D985
MLTIIADIQVHAAKNRQLVLDALALIRPVVLAEAGCHGYEPLVDHNTSAPFQTVDPNSILMLEKWQTVEHLKAHLSTPHMLAYQEQVKDYVRDVKIRILETGI